MRAGLTCGLVNAATVILVAGLGAGVVGCFDGEMIACAGTVGLASNFGLAGALAGAEAAGACMAACSGGADRWAGSTS